MVCRFGFFVCPIQRRQRQVFQPVDPENLPSKDDPQPRNQPTSHLWYERLPYKCPGSVPKYQTVDFPVLNAVNSTFITIGIFLIITIS